MSTLVKLLKKIFFQLKEMQEQLTAKETEAAELQNRVDDLDYELQKRRHRADSLENHLGEALEKIKVLQQQHQAGVQVEAEKTSGSKVVSVSQKKVHEGFRFHSEFVIDAVFHLDGRSTQRIRGTERNGCKPFS